MCILEEQCKFNYIYVQNYRNAVNDDDDDDVDVDDEIKRKTISKCQPTAKKQQQTKQNKNKNETKRELERNELADFSTIGFSLVAVLVSY